MGEANNILRNSIHTFFHGYHSFISIASLVILPFSASLLFSQSLISSSSSSSSSLHCIISSRIRSLFQSASFPSPSPLFSPLTLMLSQTIFSSLFTLPFTLTFLVLSKSSIILTITTHYSKHPPPFSSLLNLYPYLLSTHLFNSFLILSANATIFILLCFVFGAAEFMGFSSNGFLLLLISSVSATIYSIVIANTVVICNLAVMVSVMEKCSGYLSVIKACGLIKGRVAIALSIALPTNLAMAAVEALFQYRVTRQYRLSSNKFSFSIVSESFTIVYIHSIIIVVETIASCLFYKNCKLGCGENWDGCNGRELEPEEKGEV